MSTDVTLVLGGARSGKSRHAEGLVTAAPGPRVYIATARVWDEEMADRVAQHRRDRGPGWTTVEEPLDLAGALRRHAVAGTNVLVDCLTLWLTNLIMAEADVAAKTDELLDALAAAEGRVVLVSNEVGLGIVPDNALARRFRDDAGRLHQAVAAKASRVDFVAAGLPMTLKQQTEATDAGRDEDVSEDANARHAEKMRRRKALHDRALASKTIEKGLLMVHTGNGKGKSTAAFGLILRAVGHGMRVGVVQFVKGAWSTGETVALERFDDLVDLHTMGEGFTWETQDRERDVAAARAAWSKAQELMADPRYRLIVLDELNIVLRMNYLEVAEVLSVLAARRPDLHVLVTGRTAKPELVEAADLVTEMTLVKHPFQAGVKAQPGIEF